MPRYGAINHELIGSWFQRSEPGGPMWALNLMQYRDRAEYADGRDSGLTGVEADDVYAPHDHLAAVGSKIILVAPVIHQLAGDDRRWDRVAIAQYRDRMALVEMSSKDAFAEAEAHKDAGMAFSIAMASFPAAGEPTPPQESATDDDRLLLLQVVADADTPDIASDLESTRIGRFWVEDRFLGDHRSWSEARYDLVTPAVADELARRPYEHDDARYVVIADPALDEVARSLSDPSRVLL